MSISGGEILKTVLNNPTHNNWTLDRKYVCFVPLISCCMLSKKSNWFQGNKKTQMVKFCIVFGTHSRNVLIEFRWDTEYDFFAVTTFYMFYMYPKKQNKSHNRQYTKTKPKPPRNIHAYTYKYIGNSNMIYFPPRWFAINEALCTSNGVLYHSTVRSKSGNGKRHEIWSKPISARLVLPQLAHIQTHTHRLNHMNEQHRKSERERIVGFLKKDSKKRRTTNVLATHNLRIYICVCVLRAQHMLHLF